MAIQIERWFNTAEVKRFYFPGKIFSGRGMFERAIDLCTEAGTVVLVVDSFIFEGDAGRILRTKLGDKLIATKILHGAPITQDVLEFAATLNDRPAAVLAVGGGSTSDFAKAIVAHMLFGFVDGVGLADKPQAVMEHTVKPLLVSVPTTAGSGAESSRYYVTYDRENHGKVFGKSWQLIADWVMLDARFLDAMPRDILVSCAFDAFVHLFETFVCAGEASWFGEMMSLDCIPRVVRAIDRIIHHGDSDETLHLELLYAATIGGVAISNVRTGNIHEAGGALLERSELTHPETLFVFLPTAYEQYRGQIRAKESRLMGRIQEAVPGVDLMDFPALIAWWARTFRAVGLISTIETKMKNLKGRPDEIRAHIFKRVWDDKVWCNKESPRLLTEQLVRELIDKSFAAYGVIG